MSPIATLIASDPSATTTHRQPSRLSSVSMILAVIGLSSASRHVTARSLGSGPFRRSIECTDDGGVLVVPCPTEEFHVSDPEPSPALETDAVLRRLGIEFRRSTPSKWLCLNRSTAPNSDGFRAWLALPGVEGGRLVRDGEEAIEDVDVAGDGGPVATTFDGSIVVTTLGGFLIR